jgi:hypothetical protein
MEFKAGDKLRVIVNDGTLKEIHGTVFEGREVYEDDRYGKMVYEGLFFRIEKWVWDESGSVMDRYACHYCGRFYRVDEEGNVRTELDGVLKIAKRVEKLR